jgi:hypothetical protein
MKDAKELVKEKYGKIAEQNHGEKIILLWYILLRFRV